MTLKISERVAVVFALVVGLLYFFYYIFFTGIVQENLNTPFSPQGSGFYLVTITGEAYSGPGLQIINGASIVLIRLSALAIASIIAVAVSLNVLLLTRLYRTGGLRACIRLGGTAGVGAILANLVSFSYLCCGWAASLVIVGSTVLAPLSTYISVAISLLLIANAYLLRKRTFGIARMKNE